jgi:hypothetical protein
MRVLPLRAPPRLREPWLEARELGQAPPARRRVAADELAEPGARLFDLVAAQDPAVLDRELAPRPHLAHVATGCPLDERVHHVQREVALTPVPQQRELCAQARVDRAGEPDRRAEDVDPAILVASR